MPILFEALEHQMQEAPLIRFGQLVSVPFAPGVYTAWRDDFEQCFYVGMATTTLKSRIKSHFAGDRGGDRFCLYVYDSYVHQERCASIDQPSTKDVNALTRTWIRTNIAFRCLELDVTEVHAAEAHLRVEWSPTLNTLQRVP